MKLDFSERTVLGKRVVSLRRQGQTPVVCYGRGQKSRSYSVVTKELLFLLLSDEVVIETGGVLSGKQVLVQDVALHPVTGEPLHADFLFVDTTHAVEHEVPVRVEGEAPGVKIAGGQMLVALDRIEVQALPQDIPSVVVADVSSLTAVGSHLRVSDLPLPGGVTLVTNPDEIVVSIVEQSQEEEDTQQVDEGYLSNIEVIGKGGKKKDEEVSDDEPDS